MVPQDINEIGPAIAKALEALEEQLQRDRASVAKDRDLERRAGGLAAFDEMISAARAVQSKLNESVSLEERPHEADLRSDR